MADHRGRPHRQAEPEDLAASRAPWLPAMSTTGTPAPLGKVTAIVVASRLRRRLSGPSTAGTSVRRRKAVATNEPCGFDPDDLDRIFPGMGEQLRGALGQLGRLLNGSCLLYTSPSPRDGLLSRM